jgi:hypothetical protein
MKPRIWRMQGCWWCALYVGDAETPAGYGATPLEAFAAWLWACNGGLTMITADGAPPRIQ